MYNKNNEKQIFKTSLKNKVLVMVDKGITIELTEKSSGKTLSIIDDINNIAYA